MPIQAGLCLGGIELEEVSFVRVRRFVLTPGSRVPPGTHELVGNPGNGLGIRVGRTKIPAPGELRRILSKALRKHQISAQRFEDELPRADSGRVPDEAGASCKKS